MQDCSFDDINILPFTTLLSAQIAEWQNIYFITAGWRELAVIEHPRRRRPGPG